MPYARYTGMQNLADKKEELFSQHKAYFEKFVNVINKNLEKQAYTKHTKVEKRYSLEQLFKEYPLRMEYTLFRARSELTYPER